MLGGEVRVFGIGGFVERLVVWWKVSRVGMRFVDFSFVSFAIDEYGAWSIGVSSRVFLVFFRGFWGVGG